ncbi:MAG: hypothetical protein DSY91_00455, partial [Deltaproteobacteria bacterium]
MINRPQNTYRKRFYKFVGFIVLILLVGLWFLSKRGPQTLFVDHVLMNIAFPFQKVVTVTT